MHTAKSSSLSSLQIRKITYSALYLAIAMVLPFLTGQIPEIGSMLCPMHIPALLCGFVCGWPWGLAVGFISPLLRSLIFGMPTMFAAIAMAFEMGVYGAVAGFLYQVLPKVKWRIYPVLLISMVLGLLVCYAFGTAWFLLVYARTTGPVGVWTAVGWCVAPYVVPDLMKLALALVLRRRLRGAIRLA